MAVMVSFWLSYSTVSSLCQICNSVTLYFWDINVTLWHDFLVFQSAYILMIIALNLLEDSLVSEVELELSQSLWSVLFSFLAILKNTWAVAEANGKDAP